MTRVHHHYRHAHRYVKAFKTVKTRRDLSSVLLGLLHEHAVRVVTDQPWLRTTGLGLLDIVWVLAIGRGLM